MRRGPALRRDRTPTGVAPSRPETDEGFTLIEVMAAMFLFLMVSTSTAAILVQGLQTIRANQDRVSAANVARSEIEYLRDLARKDPNIIPIGQFEGAIPPAVNATYTAALNPNYLDPILKTTRYTIKTTSNWVDFATSTGSQSACTGNSVSAAYLRVVVTVDSPDIDECLRADQHHAAEQAGGGRRGHRRCGSHHHRQRVDRPGGRRGRDLQ